jgi:hypothetical protein
MKTEEQIPNPKDLPLQQANHESLASSKEPISWSRSFLLGAMAICLLLSVALFNGYPTVFSDTGSYLLTGAFFIAFEPFRAPGYSIFTIASSLGISAWFTIVVQAVIVVYVLRETCDYLVGGSRKLTDVCLIASVCVLTALTCLPWLVSLLMPDVFAGVLFLSAFLLAFADDLPLIRRIVLAGVMIISVGSHMSLFPIAALFVAVVLVLKLAWRQPHAVPPARSALAWLLVPILAAGFWTMNLNREMGLGFRLAPSRNTFLLARLFGNGMAADFLRENCPSRPFIACRYLSNLPQTPEQFLFWHPLLHELQGHEDEMDTITRGIILAHLLRFFISSANGTLLQLASIWTGDEIRSYRAPQWNNSAIEQVFPEDFQALSNDRQFRGRLLPLADAVARIHNTIFWLSVVACLLLARTGRFARVNQIFYSALIFLLINAAICATFAGVYDRYQNRVAWIIPFCLTAYISCLAREWKRSAVLSQDPACP